jgi:hypothetical protein
LPDRPGYPFLGNDFFREVGDCFSCHVVNNPSLEDEVTLLKAYAPDVPDVIIRRLTAAFKELRQLQEDGLISYPYSARELVSIQASSGLPLGQRGGHPVQRTQALTNTIRWCARPWPTDPPKGRRNPVRPK